MLEVKKDPRKQNTTNIKISRHANQKPETMPPLPKKNSQHAIKKI
jgi:hypothetical protein